jgi:hypothetical protein
MSLIDLALRVHEHLDVAGIPHAFGGALALGYVAEPRGTVDIDLNVFVTAEQIDSVLDALAGLEVAPERPIDEWMPSAGLRLRAAASPFPIDVFVSLDDAYAEVERRCVRRPFGRDRVPVPFLSAEDLVVFKLSFGRDKDWVDLRAIATAVDDLDVDYVERQLLQLRGPGMHPRLARLRGLVRRSSA